MNEKFLIKLQAQIDSSSQTVASLNKQIKTLENKIRNLEVKVKMPTNTKSGFGDLNTQLNKLKVTTLNIHLLKIWL